MIHKRTLERHPAEKPEDISPPCETPRSKHKLGKSVSLQCFLRGNDQIRLVPSMPMSGNLARAPTRPASWEPCALGHRYRVDCPNPDRPPRKRGILPSVRHCTPTHHEFNPCGTRCSTLDQMHRELLIIIRRLLLVRLICLILLFFLLHISQPQAFATSFPSPSSAS